MTVEIISWSISTKVWDRTGIELATPGSAVRHASVARHVTNCATQPGFFCIHLTTYQTRKLTPMLYIMSWRGWRNKFRQCIVWKNSNCAVPLFTFQRFSVCNYKFFYDFVIKLVSTDCDWYISICVIFLKWLIHVWYRICFVLNDNFFIVVVMW